MLNRYGYYLPEELIAKEPAAPRDSSRLLIYDTLRDSISLDTFRNIAKYLPQKSFLVFNDTKVVPARLNLTKPTGGKIEVFLLLNELQKGERVIKGIVDRKTEVGARLSFPSGDYLEVVRQEEQYFFFKPSVGVPELWSLIETYGHTPIPKYIKGVSLSESDLRERYQSMFAEHPASVAAPTASLHFTPRVMQSLAKRGIHDTRVTLHVGPGTFAPVTEDQFVSGKLHTELAHVSEEAADAIMIAKEEGNAIVTVGTTATRTLESFTKQSGKVSHGERPVDLFIYPPYEFKGTDALITNFHLPKSSLMLLVDALLKHKGAKRGVLDIYEIAIREKFRFYSFGDAMFII